MRIYWMFGVVIASILNARTADAAGTYDSIISAVDWSEVVQDIVAFAVVLASVLVVNTGARMLLTMIGDYRDYRDDRDAF